MITLTKASPKIAVESQKLDLQQAYFLLELIEGLQDAILILTETGELIHANTSAKSICGEINQASSNPNFLPPAIWLLCESLIQSRSLFPDKTFILSDEIVLDKSNIFRIRVRWLNLDRFQRPCLLVTIENRYESLKNVAIAEVKKYNFTPREAEIWFLYRSNYSYKEIGNQLYITINTVKKHMKNIHAKRQAFLDI